MTLFVIFCLILSDLVSVLLFPNVSHMKNFFTCDLVWSTLFYVAQDWAKKTLNSGFCVCHPFLGTLVGSGIFFFIIIAGMFTDRRKSP